MQEKDYYEILQVSPNAEPEVIKAAYRRLARKYHPDVDKSPEAAERMKEINAAYDILSDPAKRAAYDRLRERISAPPRYRREAPPEPERPRVPTIRCQNCGRIDNTLRLSGFLYIYSILIMSFKRGAGGLLCSSCRRTEAIKYSLVTLLFGWWGIPWGIFWSLEALGTNLFGGKKPAKENAQLLRLLALQFMAGNQILDAVQALKDSLSFEHDPKTEQFLQYLEASPEFKAAEQQSERRADVRARPPSFLRRNWPVIVGTFIGILLCVLYAVFSTIAPPPPPAEQTATSTAVPPSPTPTQTPTPTPAAIVSGNFPDIPLFPGSAFLEYERMQSETSASGYVEYELYQVGSVSTHDIEMFYRERMPSYGWFFLDASDDEFGRTLGFTKSDKGLLIAIDDSELSVLLTLMLGTLDFTEPTPTVGYPPSQTPSPSPTPPSSACPNSKATITWPQTGAEVKGSVEIQGTANIDNFQYYKIEFATGTNPSAWHWIGQGVIPVTEGVLLTWDTGGLAPGVYSLRLTVVDITGNYPPPCQIQIYLE